MPTVGVRKAFGSPKARGAPARVVRSLCTIPVFARRNSWTVRIGGAVDDVMSALGFNHVTERIARGKRCVRHTRQIEVRSPDKAESS